MHNCKNLNSVRDTKHFQPQLMEKRPSTIHMQDKTHNQHIRACYPSVNQTEFCLNKVFGPLL